MFNLNYMTMKKIFTIGIVLAVIFTAGNVAPVSAQTLTNNDMATWIPDDDESFRPFGHYTAYYKENDTDPEVMGTIKGDPGYGDADFAYQHQILDVTGLKTNGKIGKIYIGNYDFDNALMAEPVIQDLTNGNYYKFTFWAKAGQANDSLMKYIVDEIRFWDAEGEGAKLDITKTDYYPGTDWAQYSFDSIVWPDTATEYQFRMRINYKGEKGAPVVGDYIMFDNWDLVDMDDNTSIREINNFHFDIYPNPSSGLVHVATELEGAKTLSVFNMAGKEVLRKPVFELQSALDVSSLEPGIYMLRITDGVRERTRKLAIR